MMLKLMKCLVPSKGAGVSSTDRLVTGAVAPTDGADKPQQPQDSQQIQNSSSRQQSPTSLLGDQSSLEPNFIDATDPTKAPPAVDSRGVWHVHVQTSASSSQAAASPAAAQPWDSAQLGQSQQSTQIPVANSADSSCTMGPTPPTSSVPSTHHVPSSKQDDSSAMTSGYIGTAAGSAKHNSMPLPQLRVRVPKSNVRQLESLSHGRDTAATLTSRCTRNSAQETCETDSAIVHRSTGSRIASKQSTASSAVSAESEAESIPLAMAPRETPEDDAQHALLAQEVGVAPEHEAFVLWRLTQHLGAGAFSKVLLATASGALRKDLPRTCVIKVVNLGDDCKIRSDYKPVLRAEGLALQRFSFPGFVHCYAVWGSAPERPEEKAPNHLVLALEHLCGGMLLDRLKKGPLSEHHAAAAFHQIVTCILYMHHTGYLHRDLKPDNVMLTYDWDPEADGHLPPPVKLIDLGMVLNYVKQPNETGLMGSPGYMSPEAIRGHRHTPQMDMFSLGVLLFVMLTGCKPIPSAVCTKLCYDRMDTSDFPGVKMSQFRRLSAPARDLTLALMARRPASRPSAMAVLSHPWMTSHAERWYSEGVDLRDLAVPRADLAEAVRRNPRVDELLARARAARPPPQVAQRAATACGNGSVPAGSPAPATLSAGVPASNTTPTSKQQQQHTNTSTGAQSGSESGALVPSTAAAPPERSLSGSRLPPLPSEHLRQLGYGDDRQHSNSGTVFPRNNSGSGSFAKEDRRQGQENTGATIVATSSTKRAPLKPRTLQQPLAEQKTPRTRIPLVQRTPAQLNRRLSVHGSFSNSATLSCSASPGHTQQQTPSSTNKRAPCAPQSHSSANKNASQTTLTCRSLKAQSSNKQPAPSRSFSDPVENLYEVVSQQPSGGTAPSHCTSAFSGPLTAPSPAMLYKKGSGDSGHGPLLRTRGSTQSGSLPMPDIHLPSPRLYMDGDLTKQNPGVSEAVHETSQAALKRSHSNTPSRSLQAALPLPPLAPPHRRSNEARTNESIGIGQVPQKCPSGTIFRPSAAAHLSPNRRRAA